jgi:hypothetical protein
LIWLMSPSSLALPHIVLPRLARVRAISTSDRPRVTFAQITPGDLDVAVIGQLSPSQLPLDRKLEPSTLEMARSGRKPGGLFLCYRTTLRA